MERSLRLYEHQFSGLVFSFGYLFQAILGAFGFNFFDGYSLYQSLSSLSFNMSTILVTSIANGPSSIYCAILFQELNSMAALVNLRTLHHFNVVDSITTWWRVALLKTSICRLNERVEAPVPTFTTVHWLILILQLQFSQDIKRTQHFTIHLWKTLFLHPNSACQ